ncbi:MAG: PhoH family protein [Deltaproteobacteria bacterium]|nr:PhoH family protein [Deltaproteobacteria bacterium]
MEQQKNYIIDTNVLLEDPLSLVKLRNGNENHIFIPYHVLLELDKFKKDPKLRHIVARVIEYLVENPDTFQVLNSQSVADPFANLADKFILDEIQASGVEKPILVTNDRIFQLQARLRGIASEVYKESVPFKSEAEYFTGFVARREEAVPNAFMWNEQGKPVLFGSAGEKIIDYQHKVWKVTPRNVFQNLAVELMIHPDIQVVSVQSEAGYGKSYLALACALYLVLERKSHQKIYVIKPMIEIGQKLGYLPGKLEEKMEPYTRYIADLLSKLHRLRPANKLFIDSDDYPPQFNSRTFEILPLNYIRGMNIENAVVIIDEMQNMSRAECRTLLTRMGEGVKCLCLGDIRQVDNPYLGPENNGLNWLVKKFKGSKIYSHIVLKGEKSRGPITDLVITTGL